MKKIFSHCVFLSLVTMLSACSGSKTEPSENENVNDPSVNNLVTPGFGASSFRDWHQNGYVLTGITSEQISTGRTQQYQFELNTTDNTITIEQYPVAWR